MPTDTATAPNTYLAGLSPVDIYQLGKLVRELTVSFDTFEALATDNGRIDAPGNFYVPTLRADLDPRYAQLADAYDAYQIARGSDKRALRT